MSSKDIFKAELLNIVEFKLVKGNIDAPEMFDEQLVKGHEIENSLTLGFNIEKELAKADFAIEITTQSGGKNKVEAKGCYHFVYIYSIDRLSELVKIEENGKIEVDSELGNALSSVTYSTSRGVLLTRLQGTPLQNFILPIVNPKKLLNKQV